MTVSELIHELSSMNQDAEVRIAQQPQWAFEYDITTVAETDPAEAYEVLMEDDDPECWFIADSRDGDPINSTRYELMQNALAALEEMTKEHEPIVYIAEGQQLGYLPSIARAAVGW